MFKVFLCFFTLPPHLSAPISLKLEGSVIICSLCSFYSLAVALPEVQALPLALSLSPVQWDLFPALPAFSHSALSFHPDDPVGSAEPFCPAGSWCPCAGAGSIPAPGLGTLTQAGAAAC